MVSGLHLEVASGKLTLRWMRPYWEGFRPLWALVLLTYWGVPEALRLPWVCVLSLLAYIESTHIFNGAKLDASKEGLRVQPYPLPWRGKKFLRRKDIRKVEGCPAARTLKNFHQVEVVLNTKKRVVLLTRIPSAHQAQSVAKLIEQHLHKS